MIVVDDAARQAQPDLAADEARLAAYAEQLGAAIEVALPIWVERSVAVRHPGPLPDDVRQHARRAGGEAGREVGGQVRALLAQDIDEQRSNPLALLRAAVRYPAAVLADAGAPRPARDREAVRLHPDDEYDLVPASFADVHPDLHDPGITWGAAKAHVHLARRRLEGRR